MTAPETAEERAAFLDVARTAQHDGDLCRRRGQGRPGHRIKDVGVGDTYLTKIELQANQYRFYRMEIAPGLLGDWGLIREWGRIGGGGRVRIDWFETEVDAKDARFELHMKKARRGYK